jgi:hypothetical protein
MINITNITRQILWASALVMAASGEASAQAPLAVITQTVLPYFASPQAVNSKPLGQFAFHTHVCVTGKTYTWNRLQFFQYILPSGELVYTLAGKGIFARDPAGDKSCMSQVASTTLPANIPPPVQRAPQPAPNYVTPPTMAASAQSLEQLPSEATQARSQTLTAAASPDTVGTTNSANDPSMRADIADIAEFLLSDQTPISQTGSLMVEGGIKGAYNLIKNDPDAKNIDTKSAIAEGFFFRGEGTNDGWVYDDKKFNDLQRARFWYQMAQAQIRTEHPDCEQSFPFHCPSGSVSASLYLIGNRLAFCPTVLVRQQKRAAAEKQIAAADKEKAAAKKQKMDEEEAEAKFQKDIPSLLAQRKEIGDTVCDPSACTHFPCDGYGQVENVRNDKIEVRVHTQVGDQLNWINYNAVIKCGK